MGYTSLNGGKYELDVQAIGDKSQQLPGMIYNVLVGPKSRASLTNTDRKGGVNMEYQQLTCNKNCSEEILKLYSVLKEAGLSKYSTLLTNHSKNSILTHSSDDFLSNYDLQDKKLKLKLRNFNIQDIKEKFLENLEELYKICESRVKGKMILFSENCFDIKLNNGDYKLVIDPKKCKAEYVLKYDNPDQKKEEIKQYNLDTLEKYLSTINFSS